MKQILLHDVVLVLFVILDDSNCGMIMTSIKTFCICASMLLIMGLFRRLLLSDKMALSSF